MSGYSYYVDGVMTGEYMPWAKLQPPVTNFSSKYRRKRCWQSYAISTSFWSHLDDLLAQVGAALARKHPTPVAVPRQ
jgi:hypothetical protein